MSSTNNPNESLIDERFRPPGLYSPEGDLIRNPHMEWDPNWEKDVVGRNEFHLGFVRVLTRFVGVDQSEGYAPEPLIYATEVSCRFPSRKWGKEVCDLYMYSNREAAVLGHTRMEWKWRDFWNFVSHLFTDHEF